MKKFLVYRSVLKALEEDYQVAMNAAQLARDTATHEESVAENKYDTLGLEAAYLAEGQSNRAQRCLTQIQQFRQLSDTLTQESLSIAVGSLITLKEIGQNHTLTIFLSPVAGGVKVEVEGRLVMMVTTQSPMGEALFGNCINDEVTIAGRHYVIVDFT